MLLIECSYTKIIYHMPKTDANQIHMKCLDTDKHIMLKKRDHLSNDQFTVFMKLGVGNNKRCIIKLRSYFLQSLPEVLANISQERQKKH